MNKGDVLTLSTTLPDMQIYRATISFRTILSSVDVYLDGELIYSFGQEYAAAGKMLPKNENFIPLPNDFQGKELTIEITAGEEDAFAGLSPIKLGVYNDIKNTMVQGNRLPMIIGVFLCHIGFMLLILAPFLAFSRYHDLSIIFSGLTSLLIGIYILSYNDIFWYLADNPPFFTFAEYFTLYLIPAGIMGFIVATKQSEFMRISKFLLIIDLLFGLGTAFLHLTNIIHICVFVSWLHAICLTEGVFVLASLIHTVWKASRADEKDTVTTRIVSTRILIIGLAFFILCAIIDIIAYNILKFFAFNITFFVINSS